MHGVTKRRKLNKDDKEIIKAYVKHYKKQHGVNHSHGSESPSCICATLSGLLASPHVELVRRILKLPGFDVNHQGKNGETICTYLLTGITTIFVYEIFQMLFARPELDMNLQTTNGDTILSRLCCYHTVTHASLNLLDFVLTHPRLDVNLVTRSDWTPLTRSIAMVPTQQTLRIVTRLLSHRQIDVNLRTGPNFRSALSMALVVAKKKNCLIPLRLLLSYRSLRLEDVFIEAYFPSLYNAESHLMVIKAISRRIQTGDITKLTVRRCTEVQFLNGWEFVLLEALCHSTRLLSLELIDVEKWDKDFLDQLVEKNCSVVIVPTPDLNAETTQHRQLLFMAQRNRGARRLCQRACLYCILAFRRLIGKDVAKLLGQMVWETRGQKIWVSGGNVLKSE